MKEDLEFKTGEMKKSEQTTVGLAAGMIHPKAKFLYLNTLPLSDKMMNALLQRVTNCSQIYRKWNSWKRRLTQNW